MIVHAIFWLEIIVRFEVSLRKIKTLETSEKPDFFGFKKMPPECHFQFLIMPIVFVRMPIEKGKWLEFKAIFELNTKPGMRLKLHAGQDAGEVGIENAGRGYFQRKTIERLRLLANGEGRN